MINARKNILFAILATLIVGLLIVFITSDKTNLRYWFQDFARQDKPYTLLLGSSSIFRLSPSLLTHCNNPVIYGFNNGTTESVNAYLSFANLENASKVIIYIGENDIAYGEQFATTFMQLNNIVNTVKSQTKAEIGLIKIKYSPARASSHEDMLEFNGMLVKQYAEDSLVQLIPFDKISNKSWFISDGVHLNNAGNRQFSEWINNFCGQD